MVIISKAKYQPNGQTIGLYKYWLEPSLNIIISNGNYQTIGKIQRLTQYGESWKWKRTAKTYKIQYKYLIFMTHLDKW